MEYGSRRKGAAAAVAVVAAAWLVGIGGPGVTQAQPEKVLILGSTVSGGIASDEATKAIALGFGVDLVDDATWSAMTAEQFGSYRAIILGEPTCVYTPPTVPTANRAVWSPQIDGNIIVNGTDAVYHHDMGGKQMTDSGIAFATAAAGKTGLYVSLGCYYDSTAPFTPVPLLDQFGAFSVTGVGCYNDAHIVAVHPALAGLTDASISNWNCSVHEAFDSYPTSGAGAFIVLAIARGATGVTYTAPDGSVGIPYIIARGEGLVAGNISLNPSTATTPVGTSHTITAFVSSGGTPQPGVTVTFTVTAGPHAGVTATGVTDSSGNATFTYTGSAPGTDSLQASIGAGTSLQTSNTVTKTWEPVVTTTTAAAAVPTVGPTLPATGSAAGQLAPFAVAAVVLGLSLLALVRRPGRNCR